MTHQPITALDISALTPEILVIKGLPVACKSSWVRGDRERLYVLKNALFSQGDNYIQGELIIAHPSTALGDLAPTGEIRIYGSDLKLLSGRGIVLDKPVHFIGLTAPQDHSELPARHPQQ